MKTILRLFFLLMLTISCSKDNVTKNNNPYIPNYAVNFTIDLNLPMYDNLKYPSNGLLINDANVGASGVIVFNTGTGYTAFDATCPNQSFTDCSKMYVKGIMAVCPCDSKEYDLFTGTSSGMKYPLKAYRVEVNANIIRVYN